MSPELREAHLQVPCQIPDGAGPVAEGTRFKYTYFQFTVDLAVPTQSSVVEVPDEALLYHLERAGCFDYLAEPGEDIYSLEDGEPL